MGMDSIYLPERPEKAGQTQQMLFEHRAAKLRLEKVFRRIAIEGRMLRFNHQFKVAIPKTVHQGRLSGVQNAYDRALLEVGTILGMLQAAHNIDLTLYGFDNVQQTDPFGFAGEHYAAVNAGNSLKQTGFGKTGNNTLEKTEGKVTLLRDCLDPNGPWL